MKLFFAGSFNPFTKGHKSIADRALQLCDGGIVIGVGYNIDKPGSRDESQKSADAIKALYAGDSRVEAIAYQGLTYEAARQHGCDALLRGVRSVADFEYERNIADVNRRICGIETLLMFTTPEEACISSGMVRELEAFGADVSQFLP